MVDNRQRDSRIIELGAKISHRDIKGDADLVLKLFPC